MEDHVEMEQDSTSNVTMLTVHGTFMTDTADGTVTETRNSTKCHRSAENVSEDTLKYGTPRSLIRMCWHHM